MHTLARLSLAAFLSLCGPAWAENAPPAPAPDWPMRFFAGRSVGKGELRVLFSRAKPFRVRSFGRILRDGTLVLRQTIRIAGEKPSTREWRLRRAPGNRYVGTLSDATGPVTGSVEGNEFTLRYTMKGAFRPSIRQVLRLQPDGRTIANELGATTLGLPLASVRETIRKGR